MFESELDLDFGDEFLNEFRIPSPTLSEPIAIQIQKNCLENCQTSETKIVRPKQNLITTNKRPCNWKSPAKVVKRKFPGPAGILPEKIVPDVNLDVPLESDNNNAENTSIICTQRTFNELQVGPWAELCKDFTGHCFLPEKFNIEWIKLQANLNRFIKEKAPFLAVIIQSLQVSDHARASVNVTLKDLSGEIQATISPSLYENHINELKVGSVIVLRNFGVLVSGANKNCHLNITKHNLVTIYLNSTAENVTKVNLQSILLTQLIVDTEFLRY